MRCTKCKRINNRDKLVKISVLISKGRRLEQMHCPECGTKLIWHVVEANAS